MNMKITMIKVLILLWQLLIDLFWKKIIIRNKSHQ